MTPNMTATRNQQDPAANVAGVTPDVGATAEDGIRRARAAHPSGQARRQPVAAPAYHPPYRRPAPAVPAALRDGDVGRDTEGRRHQVSLLQEEDGSLVTEYGLLAVVAATVAGVVIQWASGGALVTLFNALLRHARSLVGA